MMQIIKSDKRHFNELEWLKTYWHFSFSNYYDPENVSFGALRVFNEDWVKPDSGFPMHPHNDMEIITYVIEGQIKHRDNQGNEGVIGAAELQVMTAGRGIVHSEFNPSNTSDCHLLQIWIIPDQQSLDPGWEQKKFTRANQQDTLLKVVSGDKSDDSTMTINQDASIYLSTLGAGKAVKHETEMFRKVYIFVISGTINVNGSAASTGDQIRSDEAENYLISAVEPAEFILLDLP